MLPSYRYKPGWLAGWLAASFFLPCDCVRQGVDDAVSSGVRELFTFVDAVHRSRVSSKRDLAEFRPNTVPPTTEATRQPTSQPASQPASKSAHSLIRALARSPIRQSDPETDNKLRWGCARARVEFFSRRLCNAYHYSCCSHSLFHSCGHSLVPIVHFVRRRRRRRLPKR